MKFLIDESVEYSLVTDLRKLGYDVSSIAEDSPSLQDVYVLRKAFANTKILITNDKDFGELIYKNNIPHKGVILFRLRSENKDSKLQRLHLLLEKYNDKIPNHFIVITDSSIRFR